MIVHRVEHPDTGKGPYSLTYEIVHGTRDVCDWIHPPPYADMEGEQWEGKSFACPSRAAFEHWFSDDARRRLAREGFKLALYRVHARRVIMGFSTLSGSGSRQCAFPKEHATLIEMGDLDG